VLNSLAVSDSLVIKNSIEFRYTHGVLIPHQEGMKELSKGNVKGIELALGIKSGGQKSWSKSFNYPSYGIGYQLMDIGNQKYLGFSHSIIPYISFNFSHYTSPSCFQLRVGTGLSYFTKTYNSFSNPENIAISTPLNVAINISGEASYRIMESGDIFASGNLMHYSNGSYKKPNAGLNIISFSAGFRKLFNTSKIPHSVSQTGNLRNHRILLTGSFSQKEEKDPGGEKFSVFSGSVDYSKFIAQQVRLGITLDIMKDNGNRIILEQNGVTVKNELEILKVGGTTQVEVVLDRLSALFGLGIYIYNKNTDNKLLYQRVGLRYKFTNRFYSQIALKTHWNLADYIEFGVGIDII